MTSTRLVRVLVPAVLFAVAVPAAAQRAPTIAPTSLPADVLGLACAPTVATTPEPTLRLTGGQDTHARLSYGPGDLVTINAGSLHGMEVGNEYFVRRRYASHHAGDGTEHLATVHTAGWIRIYAIDDEMSLATVTHACDALQVDDYLEPFEVPEVPLPFASRPKAERGNYGRVLVGADSRRIFGRGDFLVVNRGSEHGVEPGAHFVLYRDKRQDQNFLFELGEAVAVSVQPGTSTLHVTLARDGIQEGDLVAIRRETPETPGP